MARPALRLVVAPPRGRAGAPAAGIGMLVLAAGLAATVGGADAAREPFDPSARAAEALEAHLSRGAPLDPELRVMRDRLAARPLDAATRAVYAGLLRETASTPAELAVVRFHALRAAATAPVTIPVVAASASTLARARAPAEAAGLARGMFAYAPRAAAALLATIEPFLDESARQAAIPEEAAAWLAWARELRARGFPDDAAAWIERAGVRWPSRPDVLVARAEGPFWRDDTTTLASIVPATTPIGDGPETPWLLAFRGRVRAASGDAAGAAADAARAVALAPRASGVLEAAARTVEAAGSAETAASYLRRARFGLPENASPATRLRILVSIARLADRSASGAEALRAWREVLDLEPAHAEARRRVAALTSPL